LDTLQSGIRVQNFDVTWPLSRVGDVTKWYQSFWFNTGLVWARDQHEVGEAGIFMMVTGSQAENMEKSVE
jgi:hypothetical protein